MSIKHLILKISVLDVVLARLRNLDLSSCVNRAGAVKKAAWQHASRCARVLVRRGVVSLITVGGMEKASGALFTHQQRSVVSLKLAARIVVLVGVTLEFTHTNSGLTANQRLPQQQRPPQPPPPPQPQLPPPQPQVK